METRKQKPGTVIKEEEVCVCFNLRKASRVITQIYDDVMRPLGYRSTQITLLGVIHKHEEITVKELAEFIDTDPTTLIRNLRVLEKEKLVDLQPGEDRRQRKIMLTEKGKDLLARAYPLWKKTQDKIASLVGRQRLNQLLDDLSLALENIREDKK
ncbi:MAG TPA: MarR family winged helix-turn-helix transcriptional regulator [Verrucomicrobiae bacterium]|jgi:DNA-binding MarR family transcriptional regulator|nr:MarR family winged helix-turn-helix transcriptional regulator [Verrucomicrobiae bacterium]